MPKGSVQDELEKRALRAILTRSIYRWESAAIIGLTLILAVFVGHPLPFWQPWYWLILGALGEAGLVWSSIKDPAFRARAVAEMFREKFRSGQVADKALRSQVDKALEYRDRIGEAIDKSREGVLREHLKDVSQGINDWMENVFRLAQRLDGYLADTTIQKDLESVKPEEIEKLKRRLALEDDDTVKRQLSQVIAQKQIQRDNLHRLQNVMEQAQLQLESTTTAMGTVYSQVMILSASDVASGRAQRLQQDVAGQVQALQDVVHTMDEVYRAGIDSLGMGSAPPAAPNAPGQAARKGTTGN